MVAPNSSPQDGTAVLKMASKSNRGRLTIETRGRVASKLNLGLDHKSTFYGLLVCYIQFFLLRVAEAFQGLEVRPLQLETPMLEPATFCMTSSCSAVELWPVAEFCSIFA